jgi:hypothetical protein
MRAMIATLALFCAAPATALTLEFKIPGSVVDHFSSPAHPYTEGASAHLSFRLTTIGSTRLGDYEWRDIAVSQINLAVGGVTRLSNGTGSAFYDLNPETGDCLGEPALGISASGFDMFLQTRRLIGRAEA